MFIFEQLMYTSEQN